MSENKSFCLRTHIQTVTSLCKREFEDSGLENWPRIVAEKNESLQVGQLINKEGAWPRKDEAISRRNREEGNIAYQNGQYDMAILHYTEALRFAPCNPILLEGEDLAMAAANRSAAFYQQQQYTQAMEDIEIAVSAGYPRNSLYKLYIRRCKCELELGRISCAQKAFELAVEAIEWSGLTKDMRSDLTVNLQEAFITLAESTDEAEELKEPEFIGPAKERAEVPKILTVKSPNKKLPAATDAIKVIYDSNVGRHVMAERDIKAGEILFVESPLVSVTVDEQVESICLTCLKYTACPLPCPTCSDVNFCSLACRSTALTSFHKYECRLTHVFQETGIKDLPLLLLSFRAISQQPVEFFVKNQDKFCLSDSKFGTEDKYSSSDYSTLFNLCTHSERRETIDSQTKAVFAMFLLRCLQFTGYFKSLNPDPPGNNLSDEEVIIAKLIFHFLQCIQFNTHTIESIYENRVVSWDQETRLWKSCSRLNIGDSVETHRIGGGIFPTFALVNHSCDPNMAIVFWGRVAIGVATRTIFEGEEVNDNYGGNYASMNLQDRRKYLEKSHWFTCECKACTNNYPEYVKCSKDFKKLPGSAFRYGRCDRQQLNKKVETIKKEIKRHNGKGEHKEMFDGYIRWAHLVDNIVFPPHQDFINIRKGIRSLTFQLSPNKCRARETGEDSDE